MTVKSFCSAGMGIGVVLFAVYQFPEACGWYLPVFSSFCFVMFSLFTGVLLHQAPYSRQYWLDGLSRIYRDYMILYVPFSYFMQISGQNSYKGNIIYLLTDLTGFGGLLGIPGISGRNWYIGVVILEWAFYPICRFFAQKRRAACFLAAVAGMFLSGMLCMDDGFGRIVYYLFVFAVGISVSVPDYEIRVKSRQIQTGMLSASRVFGYLGEKWLLMILAIGFLMECGYAEDLVYRYDSLAVYSSAVLANASIVAYAIEKFAGKRFGAGKGKGQGPFEDGI